jgi:Anaphase-promoting complex, cyclosome, subunit 3
MLSESPPSFLAQRFQSLIWSCLDSDLTKTAVFHAERYFAMDRTNHDSRHLYATTLLREGQTYSALYFVNGAQDDQCTGCLDIKSKCCVALGRHRQAREALEGTLHDTSYVSAGPYRIPFQHIHTPTHISRPHSVIEQQDIPNFPGRSCTTMSIRHDCVERQYAGEGNT